MAGGAGHRRDQDDRRKWVAACSRSDSFPPIISVLARRIAAPVESVAFAARADVRSSLW